MPTTDAQSTPALLASTVVFGMPCVYGALCALRGDLPLGQRHFGTGGSPIASLALWGVAVALAAAWAGTSLRFGLAPTLMLRRRDAWAAALIVAGAALLFLSARLLRPMVAA